MLDDRRVTVRKTAFLACGAAAADIPGRFTLFRQLAPEVEGHAFPSIVDEFGKHGDIVNGRRPEC